MKTGTTLAILLFTIVAIAHLLRLLTGTSVSIGDWNAPQWVSIVGAIVPGAIAWMLWKGK
jgi:hypothetical protein